jgi:iron(III) transport system substrate-binding protein
MLARTIAVALLLVSTAATAQPAPGPHRSLYMYQGADRDQRIIEGAKKEKQVVVYTSLNTKDSVPISQAFEKKYGVKVELWRSSSEKVLQRALTEARAGRHAVDAFELKGCWRSSGARTSRISRPRRSPSTSTTSPTASTSSPSPTTRSW